MAAAVWKVRAKSYSSDEDGSKLVKRDEIVQALTILADPEAGIQLQALPVKTWRTIPGCEPARGGLVAEQMAPGNRGVYYALNPCDPCLTKCMATRYALSRRWLLVDCDPKREDPDSNSTETEHEAAREVAAGIQYDMYERGWPLPIMIDSGNGWHLLYRVDFPNDDEHRNLIRRTVHALADQYDRTKDEITIQIDRKVHDGRRISKLPGTIVRKGPHTPERPHRWARMVFVPEVIEEVTADQLREFAGAVDAGVDARPVEARPSVFKVAAGADRLRVYGRSVLEREVARVVLAPVGRRNDTLNKAAFAIGTAAAECGLLRPHVEEELLYASRRNDIPDSEAKATIKSGLDAGYAKPRDLSFLKESTNGHHRAERNGATAPVIYSMTDLMQMVFPPPKWAVPGILSEGLSILGGKPKLGKSWLALNLALTISVGGKALGSVETTAGDVLYLSLEDRLRRVQDRARKVLAGLKVQPSGRLALAVEWPRQDRGGLDLLAGWLEKADNPRLIIVDVWAKFRVPGTGRRSVYEEDYECMSALKQMLDEHNCSCLLIHHCRKSKSEDVHEELSGSSGVGGSADGTLVLTRSRCENEAILHVTGRDVEEHQLALIFNSTTCCWSSDGDAKLKTVSKVREKIIGIFKIQPGSQYMPSQVAALIEMDNDTVRKELWRMAADGLLKKTGFSYSWPVEEAF